MRTSLALSAALLLAACGTSEVVDMDELEVSSPAFGPEESIPPRFTADGEDVSPALHWSTGPAGTKCYALINDDPDAPVGTWVHWIIWNIEGTELPEAVSPGTEGPGGSKQGTNSWGRLGYGGPAPPSGTHRYYFKLYALDTTLELPPSTDAGALRKAMKRHILAEGELMGRYSRR